ncbi:MAG: TIGR04255 family protein [Roseibacillus sp.]
MQQDSEQTSFHAPIIEAVISFDCELPPGWNLDAEGFEKLEAQGRYPEVRPVEEVADFHSFSPEEEQISKQKIVKGFQVRSEDQLEIATLSSEGFSFHRLEPYERFEDYLPEIERLWDIYRKLAEPSILKRLSIRNINRIVLPFDENKTLNLPAYLRNAPQTLGDYGMVFAGVFQTLRMVCRETQAMTQLTIASEQSNEEGLPIILDIESFQILDSAPKDLDDLMGILENLRSLKNRVFRTTLTSECLQSFQS